MLKIYAKDENLIVIDGDTDECLGIFYVDQDGNEELDASERESIASVVLDWARGE